MLTPEEHRAWLAALDERRSLGRARGEAAALSSVGTEARALTRESVPNVMLPRTTAGPPVTIRDSLTLVDVFAVVSLLGRLVAQQPAHQYRPVGEGRERVHDGHTAELLRRPAAGQTGDSFMASAAVALALWGETFIGKLKGPDGQVAALSLLAPDSIEVKALPNGDVSYVWTAGGSQHLLGRGDVVHAKLWSLDGIRGVSPVRMAAEGLGLNRALAQSASAGLANGSRIGGVLTVPDGSNQDEDIERLAAAWTDRHAGPLSSGRIVALSSEVKFSAMSMSPLDAQLIEQRRMSAVEVCRIWGCPPSAIGAAVPGGSMTYANVQDEAMHLEKFFVRSYVSPLENALSADDDLCPGGTYVELLADGLLRGDVAARYAAYEVAIRTGVLTVDEARTRENLPPLPAQAERPALSVVPPQEATSARA